MIKASEKIVTLKDINTVLVFNPSEEEVKDSFVTDGKYLYYVDGYETPQELRSLTDKESFDNLSEIARAMNKTQSEVITYMLNQNKEVDYENGEDNDFTIFKAYDEHYGIAELIAEI